MKLVSFNVLLLNVTEPVDDVQWNLLYLQRQEGARQRARPPHCRSITRAHWLRGREMHTCVVTARRTGSVVTSLSAVTPVS